MQRCARYAILLSTKSQSVNSKETIFWFLRTKSGVFVVIDFPEKCHVDISGDDQATVKREDGPLAEPPAALDLQTPEFVYSSGGATPPISSKEFMPRYFKIVEHLNVPLKAHSVDLYAHPLEFLRE